jgi:hypothetical protein
LKRLRTGDATAFEVAIAEERPDWFEAAMNGDVVPRKLNGREIARVLLTRPAMYARRSQRSNHRFERRLDEALVMLYRLERDRLADRDRRALEDHLWLWTTIQADEEHPYREAKERAIDEFEDAFNRSPFSMSLRIDSKTRGAPERLKRRALGLLARQEKRQDSEAGRYEKQLGKLRSQDEAVQQRTIADWWRNLRRQS